MLEKKNEQKSFKLNTTKNNLVFFFFSCYLCSEARHQYSTPAYIPHLAPGMLALTENLWPRVSLTFPAAVFVVVSLAGSWFSSCRNFPAWIFSCEALNKNTEQQPDSMLARSLDRRGRGAFAKGSLLLWTPTPSPCSPSAPPRVEEWGGGVSKRHKSRPAEQPHSCRMTSAERQPSWPLEDRERRRRRGMFLRGERKSRRRRRGETMETDALWQKDLQRRVLLL